MDININLKFESPAITAAILALADVISQINVRGVQDGERQREIKENIDRAISRDAVLSGANYSGQAVSDNTTNVGEEAPSNNTVSVEGQALTLEQVRARLITIDQSKVREILSRFGAKKLTQVAKENYGELLREAEA